MIFHRRTSKRSRMISPSVCLMRETNVHHRIEKKWLGSLTIPFSTLHERERVRHTYNGWGGLKNKCYHNTCTVYYIILFMENRILSRDRSSCVSFKNIASLCKFDSVFELFFAAGGWYLSSRCASCATGIYPCSFISHSPTVSAGSYQPTASRPELHRPHPPTAIHCPRATSQCATTNQRPGLGANPVNYQGIPPHNYMFMCAV